VPIPNFAAPGPMRNQMNRFQRFNPMAGNFNGQGPGVPQTQQAGCIANDAQQSAGDLEAVWDKSVKAVPGRYSNYTLFVYNIGFQATDRTLWQLFSPFGTVQKVNIMLDHEKNQCKGYGFVTMTNYQEAQNAVNCLNGYFFQGRVLQVSFKGQNQTGSS